MTGADINRTDVNQDPVRKIQLALKYVADLNAWRDSSKYHEIAEHILELEINPAELGRFCNIIFRFAPELCAYMLYYLRFRITTILDIHDDNSPSGLYRDKLQELKKTILKIIKQMIYQNKKKQPLYCLSKCLNNVKNNELLIAYTAYLQTKITLHQDHQDACQRILSVNSFFFSATANSTYFYYALNNTHLKWQLIESLKKSNMLLSYADKESAEKVFHKLTSSYWVKCFLILPQCEGHNETIVDQVKNKLQFTHALYSSDEFSKLLNTINIIIDRVLSQYSSNGSKLLKQLLLYKLAAAINTEYSKTEISEIEPTALNHTVRTLHAKLLENLKSELKYHTNDITDQITNIQYRFDKIQLQQTVIRVLDIAIHCLNNMSRLNESAGHTLRISANPNGFHHVGGNNASGQSADSNEQAPQNVETNQNNTL